jgi:hypothetical protein
LKYRASPADTLTHASRFVRTYALFLNLIDFRIRSRHRPRFAAAAARATDSRDANRIFPATDGALAVQRGRLPAEFDQEAEIHEEEAEM